MKMWKLAVKKLHIVTCELHHIYDIIYNIRCPLQLLQLVRQHSSPYTYHELQVPLQLENLVASLVVKPYIFS